MSINFSAMILAAFLSDNPLSTKYLISSLIKIRKSLSIFEYLIDVPDTKIIYSPSDLKSYKCKSELGKWLKMKLKDKKLNPIDY